LTTWIRSHSVPVIDEIGPTNFRTYQEANLPIAYIFVNPEEKDTLTVGLYDKAKTLKGKINFVWIDSTRYGRHAERLGLSGKQFPAFAIELKNKHWAFDEQREFTIQSVSDWVDTYLAGKVRPTVKSEDVPATQTGPVVKVVAKSWDSIVNDKTKDVLVEFYAPWCGHCKSLQPTYETLANDLKGVSSVVISQIDATANDVDPELGIRGFPTIKLFPANSKTPVEYEGDRTLPNLLNFVKEHSGIPFKTDGSHKKKEEL